MPVLAVRCVVTQHDGQRQQSRRNTWIEADDFRTLALQATAQLRSAPDRCEYKLFAPDVGRAFVGVLLEVVRDGWSALVGPMGGPAVPASLGEERTCGLDMLIERVGFGPDAEARGVYPVTVRHAGSLGIGLLGQATWPPTRGPRESIAEYRIRRADAERSRLERGRHEGFHALRYEPPAMIWQAADLEELLARAYALLPACEPRWRESGTITHEPIAQTGRIRWALEVQRGDFVASLRLPSFPVPALAEWLASRRCEINLCHPMAKLRIASRGARLEGGVPELVNAR